ncbi:MAG TPA: FecR domain-containing protein [Opitutaceae bacterium]|nr:FecR domain-containing protein [Opitutaceae bacterium]
MSAAGSHPEDIERAAAAWVVRCDRGLSAAEQDGLSAWLAADPRHREALAEHRWGWEELDRLAGLQTSVRAVPDPDLLAPVRRFRRTLAASLLAAAAVAAAAFALAHAGRRPGAPAALPAPAALALTAPCERLSLEDGSVVDLNRGAVIEPAFTPALRRVRLVRGEASFTVAKNAARPFVVEASGVGVRAVGTVFNVRLDRTAVDVVVSEGTVKLEGAAAAAEPLVHAGQHAVVPLGRTGELRIARLSPEDLAGRLAWQPRWLDFDDVPLPEILAAFNAHNPVQLRLGDADLDRVRLTIRFRSDNLDGFVRLMSDDFGMHAARRDDNEILLRRNR